jgi:hypothetical protein
MKPKSDSRFFEVVAAQRKKWDEIAGQAIRSRAQQVSHHSQAVARAVSDLAARDAVAQHTMVGQPDPPERQRIIGSFNNGAKKAFPKRQVILLSGDGGLSMLMGDLLTAVQEKNPDQDRGIQQWFARLRRIGDEGRRAARYLHQSENILLVWRRAATCLGRKIWR